LNRVLFDQGHEDHLLFKVGKRTGRKDKSHNVEASLAPAERELAKVHYTAGPGGGKNPLRKSPSTLWEFTRDSRTPTNQQTI
jgi:hypothetical protein